MDFQQYLYITVLNFGSLKVDELLKIRNYYLLRNSSLIFFDFFACSDRFRQLNGEKVDIFLDRSLGKVVRMIFIAQLFL